MRFPENRLKPLPMMEWDTGMDPEILRQVRIATFELHGPYNVCSVDGLKNKWDALQRLEVDGIRVSKAPFPGIDAQSTLFASPHGDAHVVVSTKEHGLHGIGNVRTLSDRPNQVRHGMIILDAKARPWLLEAKTADAVLTGEEPLRPLVASVSGAAKMLYGESFLPGLQSVTGSFVAWHDYISHAEDLNGPFGTPVTSPELRAVETRARERVQEILSRRAKISSIAASCVTDERLAPVLAHLDFAAEDKIPAHHKPERRPFDNDLHALAATIMQGLRDEGMLAPCPNNAGRGVSGLVAWNAWLEGELDGTPTIGEDFEVMRKRSLLERAPAFEAIQKAVFSAILDLDRKGRRSRNPEEAKDLAAKAIRAGILKVLEDEESSFPPELRGSVCGQRYVLGGSFLRPVLGKSDWVGGEVVFTPADVLPTPGSLRHIEARLPSGRLFMADWPRIEGFNEGLKQLAGEDRHDINAAAGLDERQQDYFTKAGIVIIQVGNTSPYAYAEGDGVWRMGHFDEDRAPADMSEPDRAWRTCTDLWANTFADVEVIADVLMASGQYGNHADAVRAIEDYAEEHYGAEIVEMDPGALHVYGPTGYGVHRENFAETFRSPALTAPIRDFYVLSREPLPLDCEVEHVDWVQPERETAPELSL